MYPLRFSALRRWRALRLCALLLACGLFALGISPAGAQNAAADPVVMAPSLLQARLRQVPGLEDVRVSEHGSVVRLEGSVLNADNRLIAEAIAKQSSGVIAVQNRITLSPSLRQRAEDAWDEGLERAWRLVLFLPLLLLALLTVLLFARLGRWFSRRPWLHVPGSNPYLDNLLKRLVHGVFTIAGIVMALDLLGVTKLAGAIMGSAGLVGMVVGFAFRDIAENYLAGILLSLRRPFAPRDHLRIDNYEGRVVALHARTTVLMTLDGNELQLPNATVFKAVIVNLSRTPQRRLEFALTIDGKASISTALRLGLEAIAQVPGVLAEPVPASRVEQDSPNGTELRFTAWINQGSNDLQRVRSECIRRVKGAFAAQDISSPNTTYTIITQTAAQPQYRHHPQTQAELGSGSAAMPLQTPDTSVNAELDAQLDQYAQSQAEGNLLTPSSAR